MKPLQVNKHVKKQSVTCAISQSSGIPTRAPLLGFVMTKVTSAGNREFYFGKFKIVLEKKAYFIFLG